MGQRIGVRVLLSASVLLPYWRLVTFSVIYVTDAVFTSDIFNGELPGRVLVASIMRSGQWPVWSSQLCSGIPLAGFPADPLSLLTFGLLPTAAALDAFVIALLLVAAHGSYSLASHFGADRAGAFLAGVAFAGCGYIAAQLMHLGIIATVVWLPVALLLLDRALAAPGDEAPSLAGRARDLAVYGLVFGNQTLAGFPQSAYYCALVYGAFALFKLASMWRVDRGRPWGWLAGGFAAASLLGAAAGGVVMLPLASLGAMSDRGQDLGYAWASEWSFWPSDILMFLSPYRFGDIANNTYHTPGFFWEDYGYLGLLPVLLAAYGAVHKRRHPSLVFIKVATVVAFLFVLGRYTPVYRLAYEVIPGLSRFRGPTRFLFIVEMGIALLGGIGLTRLIEDVAKVSKAGSRLPQLAAWTICAVTVADLTFHQARRNPMVSAPEWLAAPASVATIRSDNPVPRTFTPNRFELHMRVFRDTPGWVNLAPYFRLRSALEPNLGGALWNVPSANCYAGVMPTWYVDVWGEHNRTDAMIPRHSTVDLDAKLAGLDDTMQTLLKTYGVSHVVSPFQVTGAGLTDLGGDAYARVYRVDDTARVRMVPDAVHVADEAEAEARLTSGAFEPSLQVLLSTDAAVTWPQSASRTVGTPGRASITSEANTEVVVEAESVEGGYVVLADTFYPGWSATVDGAAAPIYRANISVRAVPVPPGKHIVRFAFASQNVRLGMVLSLVSVTLLLSWLGLAVYAGRRRERR